MTHDLAGLFFGEARSHKKQTKPGPRTANDSCSFAEIGCMQQPLVHTRDAATVETHAGWLAAGSQLAGWVAGQLAS